MGKRWAMCLLSTFYFLLSTVVLSAQVATIDSKRIYASLPALAKADTLVAEKQYELQKDYNEQLQRFMGEYRRVDSLVKRMPKNDANAQKMIDNLKKGEDNLKNMEQVSNQKLAEYRSFIFQPYNEKITQAIKLVAQRLKYMQVIDTQQVPFAYLDPSADITNEVIKQLK